LEPALALQLTGAHQQHRVTVDDVPPVIDEDRAVAVPIKGDSHLTVVRHDGLGQLLGVRRSTIQIDITTVGLVREYDRIESETGEERRRHGSGGAIRAVEGEL